MLLLSLFTACGLLAPAPLATLPYDLGADTPPLALVVANRLVVLSPTDARAVRLDLAALTWDEAPLPDGLPRDVRLDLVGDRLTLWGARLDTLGVWATDEAGLSWREFATEAAAEGRMSMMLPLCDGRLLWVVERLDVEEADMTTVWHPDSPTRERCVPARHGVRLHAVQPRTPPRPPKHSHPAREVITSTRRESASR